MWWKMGVFKKAMAWLLLLPLIFVLGNMGEEGETYFMDRNEMLFTKRSVMRRAPLNTSDPGQCTTNQCSQISVYTNVQNNQVLCQATSCYMISNNGSDGILSFELLGINIDRSNWTSNSNLWKPGSFGVLTYQGGQSAFSNQTYCFTVSGNYKRISTKMFINMGGYSCEQTVDVIGTSQSCSVDCVVDNSLANAKCEGCNVPCPVQRTADKVSGIESCSLSVLTSPLRDGSPCSTQASRTCTKTCPVDCVYDGPYWMECTADCTSKSVFQTGYYSVLTSALNGGARCSLPTPTSRMCSLNDQALSASCRRDCVVTGNPYPLCTDACNASNDSSVTYTYSYTQTVATPAYGGSACPTVTTSCSCASRYCVLQPFATSTGTCNAVCSGNDGSTATGLRLYEYPVSVSGIQCTTTSYSPCYSSCSCSYTGSTAIDACTATATDSAVTPWVVSGVQKYLIQGTASACQSIKVDVPCTTTLNPVNCIMSSECKLCTCTPTTGPAYTLTTPITCTYSMLQQPRFGGSPCPNTATQDLCNQQCPGCNYGAGMCSCDFLATTSYPNSTIYRGTSRCLYAPMTSNSMCTTSTLAQPGQTCSSTFTVPTCYRSFLGCDDLCTPTSTVTAQVPYTSFGFKTCTYNTPIAADFDSQTCFGRSSNTIGCSDSIPPRPCTVAYSCPTPAVTCQTATTSSTAIQSIFCPAVTLTPAANGGACTFPPQSVSVYSTVCPAVPSPSCFGDMDLYNAVFFGIVQGAQSMVEGRLAVWRNATLLGFSIGQALHGGMDLCEGVPSVALVVGGALQMDGSVFGGETRVNETCSGALLSSCNVTCSLAKTQYCSGSTSSDFDFAFYYNLLKARSDAFSKMTSTALLKYNRTILTVQFSGQALFEVINLQDTANITWWAGYSGPLAGSATVVINILSTTSVQMTGLSLSFFESIQTRLIWNFPYAQQVIITGMKLPGLVLAPYATFYGNAIFSGAVYGLNLNYTTTSHSFYFKAFTGRCS